MIELEIHPDKFVNRHIGPSQKEIKQMLDSLGYNNLLEFSKAIIPDAIISHSKMKIPQAVSEIPVLHRHNTHSDSKR